MIMASAGTSAPTGWSRRRVLAGLLAISAVLNLFFVAGAVWTRMEAPAAAPTPEQLYRQMAAELDLDQRQRAAFDRYVAAMRARSERMHQQIAPLIAGAWDGIAKPNPDQAQIVQQFDEASRKWREFQHESTAQTIDFLSLLSPVQRRKFVALAREHRAPWLHRRRQHQ